MASDNDEPLATVVEKVWGNPGHQQLYARAYFNWVHMLEMVDPQQGKFNQAKFDQLLASMSEAQTTSLRLLREWWDGAIQEKELSLNMTKNLFTTAMGSLMEDADLADADSEVKEHFRRLAQDECLSSDPQVEESSYHEALLELWKGEFCVRQNLRDYGFPSTRRWASIAACNQRIAWSVFEDALAGSNSLSLSTGQTQRKLTFSTRTTLAVCPWLGLGRKKANMGPIDGLPYYLWDVKGQRTVEVSTLTSGSNRPRYLTISHSWGRWRCETEPSAAIDGVPWPVPLNSRFDVRDLPNVMKNKVSFSAPYIWFDLFCIPQDTPDADLLRIKASEISRQGEIFSNAGGGVIWFNDVPDWSGLEIAVLWFAATFLKQSRSRSKSGTPTLNPWLQRFENEARKSATSFFEKYEYKDLNSMKSALPSGWFSSLWTLQEVCLRPDLLLVDRDWRLLAVGPKNFVLTLDNLIAIVAGHELHREVMRAEELMTLGMIDIPQEGLELANPDIRTREFLRKTDTIPAEEALKVSDIPRAAAELRYILHTFEMTQILDAKPLTILALANQRYCKSSRAQAIMSVLGMTKWFDRYVEKYGTVPPEDDLVLGIFPFDFIKEVKEHLGVHFFRSRGSGSEVCPAEVFGRLKDGDTTKIKPIGSMLPFSSSNTRPKEIITSIFTEKAKGHPSVSTWNVLRDGTVQITQAVIFSSFRPDFPDLKTPQTNLSQLQARVAIHSCEKGVLLRDVVLSDFLKEYSPRLNIYAVLLSHGAISRHISGIFLQEIVASQGYSHPYVQERVSAIKGYAAPSKILVRVGTWILWDIQSTSEDDMPPVRDVDWRVL